MKWNIVRLSLAIACCASASAIAESGSHDGSPEIVQEPSIAIYHALFPKSQVSDNSAEGGQLLELTLEELLKVTITDTKVPQPTQYVTQKIEILDAGALSLQTKYNRNLADLLQYTSGLFVNVFNRHGVNWGSYSGLGAKYNSYLLDGLPIDSFVDGQSIEPWALGRIEAHKGPASILYSNYLNADFQGNQSPLSGTTNFLTHDNLEESLTRVQVEYGTFNTSSLRAYHQGNFGLIKGMVGISREDSDYQEYGNPDSWLQTVEDPDYSITKLFGKVVHEFEASTEHRMSMFIHHTEHTGDAGRPNRGFSHQYDTVNLAYKNQISNALHFQINAGYRKSERSFEEDNLFPSPSSLSLAAVSYVDQTIIPFDTTLNFNHSSNNQLTLGIDGQWLEYRTALDPVSASYTVDNESSARSLGAYVQEKWRINDLVLRAGARFNRIEHDYNVLGGAQPETTKADWSEALWTIGARYSVSDTLSLFTNVGTTFMAPTAKQVGGQTGHLANPNITPEDGVGVDLGFDWQPTQDFTSSMRIFSNAINNAIVDNISNNQATPLTFSSNVGKAKSNGVEIDVKHRISNLFEWFGNATLVNSKINNSLDSDRDGLAIAFSPSNIVNLGVVSILPQDLSIALYYHRVGNYYDNDSRSARAEFGNYGIVNLRVQKLIRRSKNDSLNVTLELNNLTDNDYEMPFDFREVGFNALAGLHWAF